MRHSLCLQLVLMAMVGLGIAPSFGETSTASLFQDSIDAGRRIQSLSCDYRLIFPSEDGTIRSERSVSVKFDAVNRLERVNRVLPESASDNVFRTIVTTGSKAGLISTLKLYLDANGKEIRAPSGIIGHAEWPSPIDSTFSIRHLCGFLYERPLDQVIVEPGGAQDDHQVEQFTWYNDQGLAVLSQRGTSDTFRIDIVLDQDSRIREIAEVRPWNESICDILAEELSLAREPLCSDSRRMTVDEYESVNGTWVPTKGGRRTLVRDSTYDQVLDEQLLAGTISAEEYLERKRSDSAITRVYRQEIHVVTDSIRVNEPLSAEEFDIVFPKGTIVADRISGHSFVVGRSDEEEIK